MNVTIGGDRLGSGNKNKIALHNYERSTHNLTQKYTSSLQCGTLYPFLVLPAMRGDKFEINLDADCRTIPTKGPLFGSFKMQLDLFQCDVRLYQAILHNNPLAIGLKMNQVRFPKLDISDGTITKAFSNSSLMKYLGLSGIGTYTGGHDAGEFSVRSFNAIPALAYYEIFKTYYSNKQETNAYTIGTEYISDSIAEGDFEIEGGDLQRTDISVQYNDNILNSPEPYSSQYELKIYNTTPFPEGYEKILVLNYIYNDGDNKSVIKSVTLNDLIKEKKAHKINGGYWIYNPVTVNITKYTNEFALSMLGDGNYTYQKRGLQPFALANIDDMRLALLSYHQLGSSFSILDNLEVAGQCWGSDSGTDGTGLPYINLVSMNTEGHSKNCDPLNGLVVKTYQSDLFNNWVNTEWIDGENGIANVTAISTASGSIKVDSLNLSEKLYNMLNRIAVSDGSYEGWQDAVYTETPKRHIESPIYLGGMSSEIMFEAIVQTAPTEDSALGTLAGKGTIVKNKGGHVTVKCNEACFIIGIVSLTPRVNYSQGNEFYLTDLKSMDDFHKPALDGIGFQNLIGERLAWWDTHFSSELDITRSTIGKVPAWIEYMTAVDKTFGDFAETEGRGFMALNREYGRTHDNKIQDATTYIDPRKYNYAFAYTDIDAQNFWVQIRSDIKARRLMSAKQIPNI